MRIWHQMELKRSKMNITMLAILCAVLGFLLGMAVGASMVMTAWEKTCPNQKNRRSSN